MIIVIRRGLFILLVGLIIVAIALSFIQLNVPAGSYNHQNIRTVIIDPGHGIPDGGAVGKNYIESTLNLKIAKKLEQELRERGFMVVMTRTDENGLDKKKKVDMNMRLDMMKNTPADIFVSIHINKFNQSKYRGAEVLYSENFTQSTLLAQLIMDEIRAIDPSHQSRSIKKAEKSIFLMKNASIPAVLVECGFLSNIEEEKLLGEDSYQSRIASAICDGIIEYYKNVEDYEEINLIDREESTL